MTNDFTPTTDQSIAELYRQENERLRRQLDLAIECMRNRDMVTYGFSHEENVMGYWLVLPKNGKRVEYFAPTIGGLMQKATGRCVVDK